MLKRRYSLETEKCIIFFSTLHWANDYTVFSALILFNFSSSASLSNQCYPPHFVMKIIILLLKGSRLLSMLKYGFSKLKLDSALPCSVQSCVSFLSFSFNILISYPHLISWYILGDYQRWNLRKERSILSVKTISIEWINRMHRLKLTEQDVKYKHNRSIDHSSDTMHKIMYA